MMKWDGDDEEEGCGMWDMMSGDRVEILKCVVCRDTSEDLDRGRVVEWMEWRVFKARNG